MPKISRNKYCISENKSVYIIELRNKIKEGGQGVWREKHKNKHVK